MQTIVVIPARDEEATIAEIVERTRAQGYPVLVVDDASGDATGAKAANAGAEVLRLELNRGNLGAIQAGLARGLELGYQWLITLDADGQHAPEDIPALVKAIRGRSSVVIGSCTERGSRMRHIAWRFLRLVSGLKIDDLTSGFKVYPRQAALRLSRYQTSLLSYQDIPVLLRLKAAGFHLLEVKVFMPPRRSGISRVFSSWNKAFSYMVEVTVQSALYRLWSAGLQFRRRLELFKKRRAISAASLAGRREGNVSVADITQNVSVAEIVQVDGRIK